VSFCLHHPARKLFDEMPIRDSVSFNTLICSYVGSGCIQDALGVFINMADEGFRMDGWTVTALLGACAGLRDLRVAKAAHGIARRVLKQKLFDSGEVAIALVDMYVKCGAVRFARRVFDLAGEKARNVRVWTVMMSGHARAGEIDLARSLFDELPNKDLVAWTVLIGGFVQAGRYNEALGLFEEMEAAGLEPDEVTIVTVLSACVQHGSIDLGKRLHRVVDHNGLIRRNARLATSFVHMYAKHRCLQTAVDVFRGVDDEFKTVDLFNAMINGFAHHRFGEKAISLFYEMVLLGLHPDEITLVAVLCACSHSGLVQQGFQIFNSMEEKYGVKPDIKHYACMSDLLGRVGRLDDAYRFIQNMPFKANHVVWSSLLRACRFHRNSKIGKIAEKQLCEFDVTYMPEKLTLSELFSREKEKEPTARMRKVIKHMSEHSHSQLSEKQLCEFGITCKSDMSAVSDLFSDEKRKEPATRVIVAINNKSEQGHTQLAEKLEFDNSCKPENLTLYDLFSDKKQKEKSKKVQKAMKHKPEPSCAQLAEKQLLELLQD
jgi:pentatricopeptide repeat protein